MIITTTNEKGEKQFWALTLDNLPYVYIDQRNTTIRAISTALDSLKFPKCLSLKFPKDLYDHFIFVALTDATVDFDYTHIRGNDKDAFPFIVRKKALPPLKYLVRYHWDDKLILSRYHGGTVLTENQKGVINGIYKHQLLQYVNEEVFAEVAKECLGYVIKSLEKQIAKEELFLEEVKKIIIPYKEFLEDKDVPV